MLSIANGIATGLTLSLLFLTKCDGAPTYTADSPSVVAPAESPSPATPSPTPTPVAEDTDAFLISENGIGIAQLGMTLGDLKQQLGTEAELTVESPFIVDFDAIAIRQAGEVQFYILHLSGQPLTDEDVIQGLFTENPKFLTAEGVGAGVTIQQAADAYGAATLSYNLSNEGREYVRFDRQPAPNVSFGTGNASQDAAGIYPSPNAEYNETQEFKDGATVRSVLVVCLTEACTGEP